MTEVMAQQGFGLPPPSSRQDVVSALLNDYGNSFEPGDASPLAFSPVPALKKLPPPPPPQADSPRNKSLPAVERMGRKFQLRDDEDTSLSSHVPRKGFPEQQPRRKRIVSRSLSRDAKPPSLTLIVSNGSTATIPPTPALPAAPRSLSSSPAEEKELPPPPPPKSERRKSVQQAVTGNQQPRAARELARNDSLLSQEERKASAYAPSTVDATPIVKRKALPESTMKFKSLAELGKGPRGGKGGPMPPPASGSREAGVNGNPSNVIPRKAIAVSEASDACQLDALQGTQSVNEAEQEERPRNAPKPSQLPPTPDEDNTIAAPAPPRKVFTAMGLPSNPRAKGPASPMHMRGKSSTGFNLLKAHRPAPAIPTVDVDPITPEMTPSPTLRPEETRGDMELSPVSPLSPPSDQFRPFSYEAPPMPERKPVVEQPSRPATSVAAPTPPVQTHFPPRTTSLDPPEPSPTLRPSTAPTQHAPQPSRSPPPSLPTSEIADPQSPPPFPPFTPLTRHPIPLPTNKIPKITPTQLHCYTSHKIHSWSNNLFQPMGCMVCHSNERDRKWTCTWCQLRVCKACSEELVMIPGRDLGTLLRARGQVGDGEDQKVGGDDYKSEFRA